MTRKQTVGMSRSGTPDNVQFSYIPIEEIRFFGGPGLKRYFGVNRDKVREYAESIVTVGIQQPLIVRPDRLKQAKYELIAGEHRLRAATIAGLKEVPCIIQELTDQQAQHIYGETNRQREEISIMEKAYMILYAEEFRKNGEMELQFPTENNQPEENSRRGRFNYKRLTFLVPSLQSMVNVKKISIKAGASLSYLPEYLQERIYLNLKNSQRVLDEKTAERIRQVEENEYRPYGKKMDATKLEELIMQGQPEKVRCSRLSISKSLLKKLPEEYRTKKQREALIEKLLKDFIENG